MKSHLRLGLEVSTGIGLVEFAACVFDAEF
jgi:hypothetical protein